MSHSGTAAAGAIGAYIFARKKIAYFIEIFNDLKLVLSAFIELASVVKTEIKEPGAVKAWNGVMDACAETLKDTGNSSLMQKGDFLLSKKIPVIVVPAVPASEVLPGPAA